MATLAPAGTVILLEPSPPAAQAIRTVSSHAVTMDAMGCDLLGLLRRAKASSQVIVVRLAGLPAICAAPGIEMCYTLATLKAVFDSPIAALAPDNVTVARNSYHGRSEIRATYRGHSVTVPSIPLKSLFWVATLRCGGEDEAAGYRDGAFSLAATPDLADLPHARHHATWFGLLARRPTTAAALAKATGHDPDEAAIFLAACDELAILKRKALPPGLALAAHGRPRLSGPAVAPRSLLNRLGLTQA